MLTFAGSDEKQSLCFQLLGMKKSSNSVHLISEGTSLITENTSLISAPLANNGMDTCSFYFGPSDATIMAFGMQSESCGSIAYSGNSESCGSVASSFAGGFSASAGASSCGSSGASFC